MLSLRVFDSSIDSVCEEAYDIGILASGYEARAIHVPSLVDPTKIKSPLVFGFTEETTCGSRSRNDEFFRTRWRCDPIPLSGDEERAIYEYLREHSRSVSGPIRILIDYSSMSRLWYAAVLNWARFGAAGREVLIDFVYAMGRYQDEKRPMIIREMVSIPGCEGRAFRLRQSVAVFGLGFHGLAALCVLERLEADVVYAFLASPGSSEEYVQKTRECNKDLINSHKTKSVLELPLTSIEACYRHLAETIAPHRPDGEITLVPMGPKPHVLASILVAMRFPEVACLRVSGTPDRLNVEATGEIVVTRVAVKGDS